jgi:hypothetical protein
MCAQPLQTISVQFRTGHRSKPDMQMTEVLNTAKLGLFIPALLNPVTRAAVGIGLGLLWLLRDEEQEEAVEDLPVKLLAPAAASANRCQPSETYRLR